MLALGINPAYGRNRRYLRMWPVHDPGACLIQDGDLVAAAEEERFTRIKRASRTFPAQSIEYVLSEADVSLSDVDLLAVGYDSTKAIEDIKSRPREYLPTSLFDGMKIAELAKTQIASRFGGRQGMIQFSLNREFDSEFTGEIVFIPHHRCHAASAAYCSGFEEQATLTVDGEGEHDSTVLWDENLNRIEEYNRINSLGKFYNAGVFYLGYDYGSDAGKVMGLASYGNHREEYDEVFKKLAPIGSSGYDVTAVTDADDPVSVLEEHFGPRKSEPKNYTRDEKDLAFHLQKRTEEIVKHLVKDLVKKTGQEYIALAGGVAMNCKMNYEVRKMDCVDDVFIQPAANDSGICLGAALEGHQQATGEVPSFSYSNVYLGPEYSTEEISTVLANSKLEYEHCDHIEKSVAELLAEGNLVGWFQGRMEFGARALGNRSILANPTDEKFRDQVNEHVKNRETWRPFAPSLQYEARQEYLEHGTESPYMILVDHVLPDKQDEIPAVTHVDGTTRPQTVRQEDNPRYYKLLTEFEKLTGTPVVLNTSFNVAGEPIVETPSQAIQDFYTTGLDALALGDYLLTKTD